jgi:hypothetical protein
MTPMVDQTVQFDDLSPLLAALCDGTIGDDDFARLERLLAADPAARQWYLAYLDLHGELCWDHRRNDECGMMNDECQTVASAIHHSSFRIHHSPPIHCPLPTTNAFVGSLSFSYLMAALILGLGLLVGAVTHVSQPEQVTSLPSPARGGHHEVVGAGGEDDRLPSPFGRGAGGEGGERPDFSAHSVVGRITGTLDCRFAADAKTEDRRPKTAVSLGDKFELASGLLEITYNSGAMVILQGPVRYTVESPAGGYLSVGRLTARVDNSKTKDQRPKTEDLHPSSLIPHPLFAVRTPTATVTDLGTEFGVEVARSGETTSHVFRGSVRVQEAAADGTVQVDGRVVRENQTVRVEVSPDGWQIVPLRTFAPSHFVRELPKRTLRVLDLLDIVAGGYGTTGRRERGIDATTGMEDAEFSIERKYANANYHPVSWHKLIDGVFAPSGGDGPVIVDSAGHKFAGFPTTQRLVDSPIWARSAQLKPYHQTNEYRQWVYALGDGKKYMPKGAGILALSTPKGITFNLEAVRSEYPGVRPARFQAVVAVADARRVGFTDGIQEADVWVLVDGQLRFGRSRLHPSDGLISIDIPLGPKEQFLTLATTWEGNTRDYDWVVFGDPVLKMVHNEPPAPQPSRKEAP